MNSAAGHVKSLIVKLEQEGRNEKTRREKRQIHRETECRHRKGRLSCRASQKTVGRKTAIRRQWGSDSRVLQQHNQLQTRQFQEQFQRQRQVASLNATQFQKRLNSNRETASGGRQSFTKEGYNNQEEPKLYSSWHEAIRRVSLRTRSDADIHQQQQQPPQQAKQFRDQFQQQQQPQIASLTATDIEIRKTSEELPCQPQEQDQQMDQELQPKNIKAPDWKFMSDQSMRVILTCDDDDDDDDDDFIDHCLFSDAESNNNFISSTGCIKRKRNSIQLMSDQIRCAWTKMEKAGRKYEEKYKNEKIKQKEDKRRIKKYVKRRRKAVLQHHATL